MFSAQITPSTTSDGLIPMGLVCAEIRQMIESGRVMTVEQHSELWDRLAKIELMVQLLVERQTIKEWYSTAEVAKLLGKAEFTVREWCRLGRVHASKRESGRGLSHEWIISHEELNRVRNEGLLPLSDN
jgi:hypothetical protein